MCSILFPPRGSWENSQEIKKILKKEWLHFRPAGDAVGSVLCSHYQTVSQHVWMTTPPGGQHFVPPSVLQFLVACQHSASLCFLHFFFFSPAVLPHFLSLFLPALFVPPSLLLQLSSSVTLSMTSSCWLPVTWRQAGCVVRAERCDIRRLNSRCKHCCIFWKSEFSVSVNIVKS